MTRLQGRSSVRRRDSETAEGRDALKGVVTLTIAARLTLERAPRLILEPVTDCCCAGPGPSGPSVACRACGTVGKSVESLTVKAWLAPAALARYEHGAYRFCSGMTCAVVYFAESELAFTTADVRERVSHKEPAGDRKLCYCFDENETDIAREIDRTGRSDAVQRVRTHIAAKRCACEIRNPRGTCCLGDLQAAVDRLQSTHEGRT